MKIKRRLVLSSRLLAKANPHRSKDTPKLFMPLFKHRTLRLSVCSPTRSPKNIDKIHNKIQFPSNRDGCEYIGKVGVEIVHLERDSLKGNVKHSWALFGCCKHKNFCRCFKAAKQPPDICCLFTFCLSCLQCCTISAVHKIVALHNM